MTKMKAIKTLQKKYASRAMILAIFICLLFILLEMKPVGKGLVLGTFFSIINFILMGETLPMKLGKSPKKAFVSALGSIGFRYVLMAVPLYIGIRFETFNFISVVAGIFMIQIVILADHIGGVIFPSRYKPTS